MADSALQFDRADYRGEAGMACANCKRPLVGEYWQWQKHTLCASCRKAFAAKFDASRSGAAFGKAALLGGATAIGCGIAYAIFVGVTKFQLALITIGIAYVIARVVRKASGGLGGRRFQVLAVALTYVASAMGYAAPVFNSLKDSSSPHAEVAPSPAAAPSTAPSGTGGAPPAAQTPAPPPPSLSAMAFAIVFLLGLVLAMPLLSVMDAPLGTLIVLFGLWEAWKLSRGVSLEIQGPFPVPAPPPAGA